MGISSVSLGISGGEDSVNKNKCTDDFSSQTSAFVVTVGEHISAAVIPNIVGGLEGFDQATAADSAGTLSNDVQQSPNEGHLTS